MAIRIKSRHGESVGQMLRRFKKLCEKEGLTKDVKRKQYFEKPSERKRRSDRKSASRMARVVTGAPRVSPRASQRGGPGGPGRGPSRGPR
ncbi:MAG: 30S ribosomal protein S21 [Phycisphaeraceae bacterium]|nr:30S ribosomal protein S21 [Phycisphaeraceae bacterium]